jgi:hypothetical protein
MMLMFDERQSISPAGLFYPLFALFFAVLYNYHTFYLHSHDDVEEKREKTKGALSLFNERTERGLAVCSLLDDSRKLVITTTTG